MDPETFEFFIEQLLSHSKHGLTLNEEGQYVLNDCTERDQMPNVSLLYGDHWFEMFAEDYIYVSNDVCKICIYGDSDSENRWIIGNSFMRGYYVTHDLENLSFGIAP